MVQCVLPSPINALNPLKRCIPPLTFMPSPKRPCIAYPSHVFPTLPPMDIPACNSDLSTGQSYQSLPSVDDHRPIDAPNSPTFNNPFYHTPRHHTPPFEPYHYDQRPKDPSFSPVPPLRFPTAVVETSLVKGKMAVTQPLVDDKFTKSRAVGQSHRDNERVHVERLKKDIEQSRAENILLFALFASSYKRSRNAELGQFRRSQIQCTLPSDTPEDPHMARIKYGTNTKYYRLSRQSAELLGQDYISSALASVLLELIIYRRNIVADDTVDASECTHRRRRRRSSYCMGTSHNTACQIMEYATRLFAAENPASNQYQYIYDRMGELAYAMEKWAAKEQVCRPAEIAIEASPPPPVPLNHLTPSFMHCGANGKSEGAKRCSRCNMLKFTGSGHGRSKCDDGYSISSPVPYPATNSFAGQ